MHRVPIAVVTAAVLCTAACSSVTEDTSDGGDGTRFAASSIDWNLDGADRYHRLATYPVVANAPDGEPADTETVAEISTVSADGNTMIYTDATAKRVGFVDISNPAEPRGLGTLSLAELGSADDQPTSVIAHGEYVLVVVDTTAGDFAHPSGRVDVVRIGDRSRVRSIDLGGQPDSIAISADGSFAAIAMENQRDEEFTPPGGDEGDLPQPPTGFVSVVDLVGEPDAWQPRRVEIDVEQARKAGLDTPEDLEPEYVTIASDGRIAVSLQENNGIAIIDGPTGDLVGVFSTGTVSLDGVDTVEDGAISLTGSITDVPREPDAIGWIDDKHLAAANEGDWKGGTRGWSVFDVTTGEVVWDARTSFEYLATRTGLHNEGRAEAKGTEPEGLAITEIDGTPVALVASERSNFVAVYDVSDPAAPAFRQILPTTPGPEGILPIPDRGLLAISSETDDAEAGVRATISLYGFGERYADDGGVAFPTVVSGDVDGVPIGWGALGALSPDPDDANRLYTITDNAYGPSRLLGVDVSATPAVIDTQQAITENGEPVSLDVEGISARGDGGFALAVEGEDGAGNELVQVAADGTVEERIALPADIAAGLGSQGLEGVAVEGDSVWVAVQRELDSDPKGIARIGRYTPSSGGAGSWEWFGYQLEATDIDGDWIGLSEIMVHDGALYVLERDKLNGPDIAVKGIYRVDIPTEPGVSDAQADPPGPPQNPRARPGSRSAGHERLGPGEGRGNDRRRQRQAVRRHRQRRPRRRQR
ncbi:hypothetical protein Rrhod_1197 [Rhodococcus rhodnii LMG 5362]|uniref:Phytase-like domain-containing protein n=1 Tax=Rhodococcus rhodnii LMG 5362 TaxID=1273125 RepID=R7WPZ6_9NOCA|nr:hypothetical protein Rrhod_1197 [Rhodococcus rhodnii LMG 5362]